MRKVNLQAHKGVCTDYPENTMSAFRASVCQNYDIIELDLDITKDKKIVVLHDDTINRTGRNSDGTPIEREINIKDITRLVKRFKDVYAGITVLIFVLCNFKRSYNIKENGMRNVIKHLKLCAQLYFAVPLPIVCVCVNINFKFFAALSAGCYGNVLMVTVTALN